MAAWGWPGRGGECGDTFQVQLRAKKAAASGPIYHLRGTTTQHAPIIHDITIWMHSEQS
jgi:hypothetical protein